MIRSDRLTREDVDRAARRAGLTADVRVRRGGLSVKPFGYGAPDAAMGYGVGVSWDAWGTFLAELFALDPRARTWFFRDAEDFHHRTGGRFRDLSRDAWHRHTFTRASGKPGRVVSVCDCGARALPALEVAS